MDEKSKISLKIDGQDIHANAGATILEAALQNGIHIPTLCHHPALSNWGSCRMCVVEVDAAPRLAASCVMPVREGMQVVTRNERITESRRTVLEFIFAERNHNCMFCPQSGDCELQKLAYELQMDHLTVSQSFERFPVDLTNPYMGIDHNRCILCARCVRACAEISGNHALTFQNRGPRSLVGLDLNATLAESTCSGCGVCMQVCPTGAIFNRQRSHYAVKGHDTGWESVESVCPVCGLLCPTLTAVRNNQPIKIEGKLLGDSDRPDRGQLCHKGRFEVFQDKGKRLLHPLVRSQDGRWIEARWDTVFDTVAATMKSTRDAAGSQALFGLTSSMISNELLVLFRDLLNRGWSAGHLDTIDGAQFRNISSAFHDTGNAFSEAPWQSIAGADFVLLCGGNPRPDHPLILSLIRRGMLEGRTQAAIVGSEDYLDPFTSYFLAIREEEQDAFFEVFYKTVNLEANGLPSSIQNLAPAAKNVKIAAYLRTSPKLKLDRQAQRMFDQLVMAFLRATQPILIAGPAISKARQKTTLQSLVALANLRTPNSDNIPRLLFVKSYGNSTGAWKLGLAAAENSAERKRRKAGLVILEEEAASDLAALKDTEKCEFLAVISPYFPDALAHRAHVLIPRPSWMEESGTYTSMDGNQAVYVKNLLAPPQGMPNSWQILAALADRTPLARSFANWNDLCRSAQQAIAPGAALR